MLGSSHMIKACNIQLHYAALYCMSKLVQYNSQIFLSTTANAQIECRLLPTVCLGITKLINTSTTTTTIIDDAYPLPPHCHRHPRFTTTTIVTIANGPPASVAYAHNHHSKNDQHHVTTDGEGWGGGQGFADATSLRVTWQPNDEQ